MSNWSLINQLTTELNLNIMAHRQDDPITLGNYMNTLCFLRSTDEIGGKIRRLGGVETIIKLLPRQFSEKRGENAPQSTWTLNNNNLRFTLRTLRHLTEPDINDRTTHDARTCTLMPNKSVALSASAYQVSLH